MGAPQNTFQAFMEAACGGTVRIEGRSILHKNKKNRCNVAAVFSSRIHLS
jgi:hypothetical protein